MKCICLVGGLAIGLLRAACQRGPAPERSRPSVPDTVQDVGKAAAVDLHGAPLTGAPLVQLETLLTDPRPYVGKNVTVEAPVRQACTRKGCWMELAANAKGPGVRVRFKDYGFFVPTDSAGSRARVEGEVEVAEVSEGRAEHWASEGAHVPRDADGKYREVQLTATGVELRRAKP